MRRSKSLAWLLVAALLAASLAALAAAAPAEQGPGLDRHAEGDDDGEDHEDGNATSSGPGSGRGHGRGNASDDDDEEDDRGEGMRDLAKEQGQARSAFHQDLQDRRADCRAMTGEAREDCEEELEEDAEDFREAQREAFEEAREALREAREEERLGRFALANGTFAGTFVSFGWDASVPALTNYTVGGCLVFASVAITGVAGDAEIEFSEHGRSLKVEAGHAKLKVHDNPGGVLAARAPDNGTVAFTLAPGITGALNGSKVSFAGCANWTATLSGHNLTFGAGQASVDRQGTFVAHDRNPALPEVAEEHRDEVERAKAERRVGAEVTVVGTGDEDVDEVELDEALDVHTEHRGAGGLRVIVNGTGAEPRTVVLNVAPGLLVGDHVLVRYYDEANGTFTEATITRADSLADVLDPGDDAGPEFWVEHGANGTVAYVSIDHWSTHAFTVQGLLAEVPPSVAAGVLAAVVFVAAAGAGLFRRRRQP